MSRNQRTPIWSQGRVDRLLAVVVNIRYYGYQTNLEDLIGSVSDTMYADIPWYEPGKGTPRERWRAVLYKARDLGLLDNLLDKILKNPAVAGAHEPIRKLLAEFEREPIAAPPAPAVAPTTFDVFRIPTTTPNQSATERTFSVRERFRSRLDIRLGLRRGAHLTILADQADDDLCGSLNTVEHTISQWNIAGWPPRAWWVIQADYTAPPTTVEQLTSRITNRMRWDRREDSENLGIVLSFPASHATASVRGQIKAAVGLLPTASVVCRIHHDRPYEAAEAANRLARSLGATEFLLRLTPMHEPAQSGRRPPLPRGTAAAALIATLHDSGGTSLPPDNPDATLLPDDVAPMGLAHQLIEELNADDPWANSEEQVLAAVRRFRPDLFPALLTVCAASRDDPQRFSSLRVAARTDQEIDSWIDAAGGNLPDPGTIIPSRLIDSATADAMVLALLRRNDRDTAGRWVHHAAGSVRAVFEAVRSGRTEEVAFVHDSSAEVTIAGLRADIATGVELAQVPNASVRPGCWAVLARRGITDDVRAFVDQLDDQLRMVLEGTVVPSVLAEESLTPLRNGLWPPLDTPG